MTTHHTIGDVQTLLKAGRHAQAEAVCREMLGNEPGNIAVLNILSSIIAMDERYEESASYLEPVLQNDPENPDLLLGYGRLLRLAKRAGDALPYLRKANTLRKSHPACLELGYALANQELFDEACTVFNKALELDPACIISIKQLGHIAMIEGDPDKANQYYEKVVRLAPGDINSYPELIENRLMAGEPQSALDLCEKCLQIEPASTGTFGFKYIALSELEDTRGVNYMLDPERHIRTMAASCPPSFDSIQDFNSYLAYHVLNNTEKCSRQENYTTKGGWQTKGMNLFDKNKQLGDIVENMLSKVLEEYISHLPDDPEHPIIKGRPSAQHTISWAVVLDRQGHQDPHIHPGSWLSCVYYIQLPEDFDSQPEPDAGHIVFGQGKRQLHPLHKPATKVIKPVEGNFIMFPSYAWHCTIPLLSEGQRISMAFDVVEK